MTVATAFADIRDRLETALGSGLLPEGAEQRGAQLLARLNTPVSVVVAGPEGSGKSSIINMLIGDSVIPETPGLPVLEIAAGATERTVLVRPDGSETRIEGNALGPEVSPDVAVARLELPLPLLRHMSFTEIRVAGSPAEQRAAADLATRRGDIVLWCTEVFDPSEQALWAVVPDEIKDHGFLVLTKSDRLLMRGELENRIAALQTVAAEDFLGLYPVATLSAIAARANADEADDGPWKASGGHALARSVMREVATGRNADAGNALAFLNRFSISGDRPDVENAARTESAPPHAGPDAEAPDARDDVVTGALDYLGDRAGDLMLRLPGDGSGLSDLVLEHCVETAAGLSDILARAGQGDPVAAQLTVDATDGMDMLVLLQLERSDEAAEDAVSLLLQLKKELAEHAVRTR